MTDDQADERSERAQPDDRSERVQSDERRREHASIALPDGGRRGPRRFGRDALLSAAEPAALYDRWAGVYDLLARWAPGLRDLRERTVDALRLERGDTVVEVGCGTGVNLPLLARRVGPTGRVVGLDLAPGSVERARRNTRAFPQVDVLRADAVHPPIADDVDAVLGTFLVGMLDDPSIAVDRWCDLVAGDGHVAMLHMRRSHHPAAPVCNLALDVVARLSAPPTLQLRYEESPTRVLDRRVREAHDALRARADANVTESHALDLMEIVGGKFE